MAHFRSWLQADLQPPENEVRSTPNNGHFVAHAGLPLLTRRRHSALLTNMVETTRATSFGMPSQAMCRRWSGLCRRLISPLKKASLTGFHATTKHNAAKSVSPSSETMRTT